jgi:hypothetical protein
MLVRLALDGVQDARPRRSARPRADRLLPVMPVIAEAPEERIRTGIVHETDPGGV